jgi:hypothetical protein
MEGVGEAASSEGGIVEVGTACSWSGVIASEGPGGGGVEDAVKSPLTAWQAKRVSKTSMRLSRLSFMVVIIAGCSLLLQP